jgi:hypothetical protein
VKSVIVYAKRAFLIAVGLLGASYAGDYIWLRYRMNHTNAGTALGSVEVHRYWVVPFKDNKFEYDFDAPVMQTCVHSLFPHLGFSPCWYLNRDKLQRVAQLDMPAKRSFGPR